MIQPKISVVMVCYNAVNNIEKTILYVINLLEGKSWNSMLVIFKKLLHCVLICLNLFVIMIFVIRVLLFRHSSCQGGPIPQNMARAWMPRQPYSVAVPSTGGRLHPLVPEGREAW